MNNIEIKVGRRYNISPNFFHSVKHTQALTREVVVLIAEYTEGDPQLPSGWPVAYYVVKEMTNGPPTSKTPSGRLWVKGDLVERSPMSWKFSELDDRDEAY